MCHQQMVIQAVSCMVVRNNVVIANMRNKLRGRKIGLCENINTAISSSIFT